MARLTSRIPDFLKSLLWGTYGKILLESLNELEPIRRFNPFLPIIPLTTFSRVRANLIWWNKDETFTCHGKENSNTLHLLLRASVVLRQLGMRWRGGVCVGWGGRQSSPLQEPQAPGKLGWLDSKMCVFTFYSSSWCSATCTTSWDLLWISFLIQKVAEQIKIKTKG